MALSKIDVSKMITGVTPLTNGGTGGTSIPATNLASGVTGTLPVGSGGTGLTSGTTDQLLKFTGSTTLASSAISTGKIGQVVQNIVTDGNANTTSGEFQTTNFDVAITPSATSSKVYLIFDLSSGIATANKTCELAIYNGSTKLMQRASMYINYSSHNVCSTTTCFLHSPNTSSAITYTLRFRCNQGDATVYVYGESGNEARITAMEVLA